MALVARVDTVRGLLVLLLFPILLFPCLLSLSIIPYIAAFYIIPSSWPAYVTQQLYS